MTEKTYKPLFFQAPLVAQCDPFTSLTLIPLFSNCFKKNKGIRVEICMDNSLATKGAWKNKGLGYFDFQQNNKGGCS